jgi:enamine deaminase RidA (YjgF/YER057c/UK114 family)
MTTQRLNPENLHANPAFTQVVIVSNSSKLVYVGGQNAMNTKGEVVGDDLASQAKQAYKNVIVALAAADATFKDVFKMTVYLVQGHSAQDAYAAIEGLQDKDARPPTISVLIVAGLANPQFLIEIEAVAAIE